MCWAIIRMDVRFCNADAPEPGFVKGVNNQETIAVGGAEDIHCPAGGVRPGSASAFAFVPLRGAVS